MYYSSLWSSINNKVPYYPITNFGIFYIVILIELFSQYMSETMNLSTIVRLNPGRGYIVCYMTNVLFSLYLRIIRFESLTMVINIGKVQIHILACNSHTCITVKLGQHPGGVNERWCSPN